MLQDPLTLVDVGGVSVVEGLPIEATHSVNINIKSSTATLQAVTYVEHNCCNFDCPSWSYQSRNLGRNTRRLV